MKKTNLIPDLVNKSKNSGYSQVPHSLIRSNAISGKAFKILCVLASNQEGWKNYESRIIQLMQEGKSAVESGIKELKDKHYLRKIRYRHKDNKQMAGSFWVISYTPDEFASLEPQIKLLDSEGFELFPPDNYSKTHPPENQGDGNPEDGNPPTGNPSTKYINNKNNNNKDNNTSSESSGELSESACKKKSNKPSIGQRNKKYLPIAKHLSKTIQQEKNIDHSTQQIKHWANDIRKLIEINKVSPHRIKKALTWYRKNIGGQYIPVIESGASLRDKFIRLEDAMKRKNYSTPSNKPATGYYEPDYEFEEEDGVI